jgi:hypothetical protein
METPDVTDKVVVIPGASSAWEKAPRSFLRPAERRSYWEKVGKETTYPCHSTFFIAR